MREKGSQFSLPGGGLDYGEDVQTCLQRELQEEIALEGEFHERFLCVLPFFGINRQAWQMWIVYELNFDHLKYSVGEHSDEIKWMKPQEIDTKNQVGKLLKQVMKESEKND